MISWGLAPSTVFLPVSNPQLSERLKHPIYFSCLRPVSKQRWKRIEHLSQFFAQILILFQVDAKEPRERRFGIEDSKRFRSFFMRKFFTWVLLWWEYFSHFGCLCRPRNDLVDPCRHIIHDSSLIFEQRISVLYPFNRLLHTFFNQRKKCISDLKVRSPLTLYVSQYLILPSPYLIEFFAHLSYARAHLSKPPLRLRHHIQQIPRGSLRFLHQRFLKRGIEIKVTRQSRGTTPQAPWLILMHNKKVVGWSACEINWVQILSVWILLVRADEVAQEARETTIQVLVEVLCRVGWL